MAELTIEEARKIYATTDDMKSLMLTKFTKEALEKHEVTQEEFDKIFLELLGQCSKTAFLNEVGDESQLPKCMRALPIALLTASQMSIALMGMSGIH